MLDHFLGKSNLHNGNATEKIVTTAREGTALSRHKTLLAMPKGVLHSSKDDKIRPRMMYVIFAVSRRQPSPSLLTVLKPTLKVSAMGGRATTKRSGVGGAD